ELAMMIGVGAFKADVASSAKSGDRERYPSADAPKDGDGKPRFVPHRPPARLPKPRNIPAPPARKPTQASPAAGRRTGLIVAIAAVLILGGAGSYFAGLIPLGTMRDGNAEPELPIAVLTPAPVEQSPIGQGEQGDASPTGSAAPPVAQAPL